MLEPKLWNDQVTISSAVECQYFREITNSRKQKQQLTFCLMLPQRVCGRLQLRWRVRRLSHTPSGSSRRLPDAGNATHTCTSMVRSVGRWVRVCGSAGRWVRVCGSEGRWAMASFSEGRWVRVCGGKGRWVMVCTWKSVMVCINDVWWYTTMPLFL